MSYILDRPNEKFYNYIGISKLCCRGCYALVHAINITLGRGFAVRGCHHKFYYPWNFPQIPDRNDLARSMLSSLCYKVGQTCKGLRAATQKYLSDSEGASNPFKALSVGLEDDGLRLIQKVSLKSKNQWEPAFFYRQVVSLLNEQYPCITYPETFEVGNWEGDYGDMTGAISAIAWLIALVLS